MLKVEKVDKFYGQNKVLHQVSMEIKPGTIHGLIGENGSGKTTLIKCIAGIYQIQGGSITLDGEVIYDNPSQKARIGYVADYNTFIPHYRVEQMVDFYREMYPGFDSDYLLKFRDDIFHLNYGKRIFQLSKGQKMRLALFLNCAINPKLLLLDEPTSGLDPIAKKEWLDFLTGMVEERGTSVLISSHNLSDMETLCDEVTLLRYGRVLAQREQTELLQSIRKFQMVLPKGLEYFTEKELRQTKRVLDITHIGKVYTFIFREEQLSYLKSLWEEQGALYVEELEGHLEDIYYETFAR